MEMRSQRVGSRGYEPFTVIGTAKGGCAEQRTGDAPSVRSSSSRRAAETLTDWQSTGLMEERYGIREEGIF